MNRRELLLFALALGAALPAAAQTRKRMPRIGYLLFVSLADTPSRERQAFLDGLREHGYVPGKSVEIVYRSAQNEEAFLPDMIQELLAEKVDVVVVSGAVATLAAKKEIRSVPVVIQALGDPVGIGVVRSLSRPEGNITGVSFISSELAPKRVQLIRDIVPAAKRVAVLWDSRNANARAEMTAAVDAVKRLGMQAEPVSATSDAELSHALEKFRARRPDVLYVAFESGMVASNRTLIAQFGEKHRIPIISGWNFLTEAGALVSYAPDIPAMFRRSASYVDRILRGAKPGDLPIEQATTVELVLNLRTAKALGIRIPPSVRVRADRVIE